MFQCYFSLAIEIMNCSNITVCFFFYLVLSLIKLNTNEFAIFSFSLVSLDRSTVIRFLLIYKTNIFG